MLKKTINLIKSNPIIILCYIVYLVISILIIILLYPKSFGLGSSVKAFNFASYIVTMRNMMIALLLMFGISLFFISGFCNMIREAVFSGKTKLSSFIDGIKNYIGRVCLCVLLTAALILIGSVLVGILSIPITIIVTMNGNGTVIFVTMIIMLVTLALVVIPSPFLVLWMPALFLENAGVIQSLRLGAKAGAKNYWRLLVVTVLLILPQAAYSIFNYNVIMSGSIYSFGYFILLGVMTVVSFLYNIYIYVLYHEYRLGLIPLLQ